MCILPFPAHLDFVLHLSSMSLLLVLCNGMNFVARQPVFPQCLRSINSTNCATASSSECCADEIRCAICGIGASRAKPPKQGLREQNRNFKGCKRKLVIADLDCKTLLSLVNLCKVYFFVYILQKVTRAHLNSINHWWGPCSRPLCVTSNATCALSERERDSLECLFPFPSCRGRTTPEVQKGTGLTYDLGLTENLANAFGTNWKFAWLSPFVPSPLPGDGVHFKERELPPQNGKAM